ncbi:transposase [Candidatus Peregrinibacteria bacterium]|nr:transposase [Candidatus Peregrinibacteria bacterium]
MKQIDWGGMIELVSGKYSCKRGRNSKSLRMMIALEIAKRKLGLSDIDIVEQLKVDIALKVFCGFKSFHHDIPNPSSLTYFRRRLDEETLRQLEEVNIQKIIRKVPKRIRHQVISDTTCVPANITYPTDSKLLATAWKKLVGVAERIRGAGVSLVIRGKRKIASAIRNFNLRRKKTKAEVRKMNGKLVRVVSRAICFVRRHLRDTKEEIKTHAQKILDTAEAVVEQQKTMLRQKVRRIKDRIVSFHEPNVRPLFRGKDGKTTEFGPKVCMNVIGGALVQTAKLSHDNFSDTEMVSVSMETHKKTFKRYPNEFIADRGAHSPKNHNFMKKNAITDGIQYRGKIPKMAVLPPQKTRKRMYRRRSLAEGKIGTFKTRYQGNRNRYADKNAQCWMSFGFITMNAAWAAAH